MTNYISRSACHGKKPRQLMGQSFILRNTLLVRMMRDRTRVRYLLAPPGFGKTLLAGSYAQIVNGYEGTFWLSCFDPCFLRDLDAGTLANDLIEVSQEGDLVVFDDMPAMNKKRCRLMWSVCHRLLLSGREVIVCATPAIHPLEASMRSCLTIMPLDFVYRDEDFESLRSMDIKVRHLLPPSAPSDRVPALALRTLGCFEQFLSEHIEDIDDMYQAGLSFVTLVVKQGSLEQITRLLEKPITAADLSPDMLRPFVVVDEFQGIFDAAEFPLSEVVQAFSPVMHRIAPALGFKDVGTFVIRLANLLVSQGNYDGAVQLMRGLSMPAVRAAWLRETQRAMLDAGQLVPAELLFESLRGTRYWKEPHLACASAMRRNLLKDPAASEDLLRIASKEEYDICLRVQAAAMGFLATNKADQATTILTSIPAKQLQIKDDSCSAQGSELVTYWKGMLNKETLDAPQLPLTASICIHALKLGLTSCCSAEDLAPVAQRSFEHAHQVQQVDIATLILFREIVGAPKPLKCALKERRKIAPLAEQKENILALQQAAYSRIREERTTSLAQNRAAVFAHRQAGSLPRIPLLRVKVFGHFAAFLDGEPVGEIYFKRVKVRTLLGLLVLEDGHDLSTNVLSSKLWPDSTSECARHNLHSTSSRMRHALMLPGGECPYVQTRVGAIGLDPSLVSSDAADLDALCRKLRFDEPDAENFLRVSEQIRQLYSGELLLGEDNALVIAARRNWLDKVVMSLITGARRLMVTKSDAAALNIAQQALDTDPSREDCYEILMSIQAQLGQRPAAIDTWFSYCRYMGDELGLEPSTRVKDLYSQIISD